MVGSVKRTYLMYLPKTLSPAKPAPFVYVFHGHTMSGQSMHDITQYATLADSEGIAVVFPDGDTGPNSEGGTWNQRGKARPVRLWSVFRRHGGRPGCSWTP